MKTYRDLEVWRKAVALAVDICRLVRGFPSADRYELGSQMKRAAISIPSNIAEGHGRFSLKDRTRFLGIARGSANELDTQLEIARRLDLVDPDVHASIMGQLHDVARALAGLIRYTTKKAEQ